MWEDQTTTFRLSLALGLLLVLAAAPEARAQSLAAPELFVRDLDVGGAPVGDWQPLAGAQLRSVYGDQLGARLQATGQPDNAQRFLPAMTGVPDGEPTQPDIYNLCPVKRGAVGEIVALDGYVRFEGDGPYGVRITVTTGTTSGSGCDAGPSSEGQFTTSTPATIRAIGVPLLNPLVEPPEFAGVEVAAPLGASRSETLCARDPVPQPDGSLTGTAVRQVALNPSTQIADDTVYTEPGNWSCVVRGRYENAGPWSAPTPLTLVQGGYRGLFKPYRLGDSTGPTYRFSGVAYPPMAGATGILEIARVRGCTRTGKILVRRKGKKVARGRIGPGGAVSFRFRLKAAPASGATYLLTSSITGSPFVKSTRVPDFGLVLARKGRRTVGQLAAGVC